MEPDTGTVREQTVLEAVNHLDSLAYKLDSLLRGKFAQVPEDIKLVGEPESQPFNILDEILNKTHHTQIRLTELLDLVEQEIINKVG